MKIHILAFWIVTMTTVPISMQASKHSKSSYLPSNTANRFSETAAGKDGYDQTQKKITGVVQDENGEVIIGATIKVVGTSQGVISDIDGKFQIEAPAKSVLEVSYVGYSTRKVSINNQTFLKIILKQDVQALDEVVVVAYGTKDKATVTGALSTMSSKELTKIPVASVTNLLAGSMPGVTSVQTTGQPGRDEASIYVRGGGSLTDAASKPLILVDGIERDFNSLDPNEIESVSVLKDASSTAVFGVRGANGVILVTTKRGVTEKPSISVSSSLSLQQPIALVQQTNSYDYARFFNLRQQLDGVTDPTMYFTKEQVEAYRTGSEPILYPSTDWGDYMFNDFMLQSKNNVNITGGTDLVKYFVSIGYLYQNGIIKQGLYTPYDNNYRFERYNYRANLDFTPTKTTTIKINIGGNVGKTQEPNSVNGESPWTYAQTWSQPFASPGLVNGVRTIVNRSMLPAALQGDPLRDGFYPFAGYGYKQETKMKLNMDLELIQKLDFITKGLSIGIKGAYDNRFNLTKNRTGGGVAYQQASYKTFLEDSSILPTDPFYDKTIVYTPLGSNIPLSYSEYNSADRNWYIEAKINYDRKFGDHNLSGLLLYNQSRDYYPMTATGKSADYVYIPRGYVGLVGRVTYDYLSKYLLDVNMGYNGSENFAPGKTRFGLFPSFSAGWVISAEKFMERQKVFDYLKLRVSWGRVGSDVGTSARFMYMPAVWSQNGTYSFGVYNTNGTPIYQMGSLGNDDITWETADKQNYGIDMRFLNGRLSVTADYFMEHRKDILITPNSTPSIIAMTLQNMNLGKVDNHGYELSLGWRDQIDDWSYHVKGNISYSKNKIVYMDEVPNEYSYMDQTGGSTGRQTGLYRFERLYQYSDFIDDGSGNLKLKPEFPQPYVTVTPGDAMYADLNKDGIVDSSDRETTGYSTRPEYMFDLNAGFEYKNFAFSMQWLGATHVDKMLDKAYRIPFTDSGRRGLLQYFVDDCWTPYNQSGTLPRPATASQSWNSENSTLWLRDASYLRLKSVSMSYTLRHSKLRNKLGINSLVFTLSGYNLLTFSPLDILDPETITSGGGVYPMVRLYNLGLTVNF